MSEQNKEKFNKTKSLCTSIIQSFLGISKRAPFLESTYMFIQALEQTLNKTDNADILDTKSLGSLYKNLEELSQLIEQAAKTGTVEWFIKSSSIVQRAEKLLTNIRQQTQVLSLTVEIKFQNQICESLSLLQDMLENIQDSCKNSKYADFTKDFQSPIAAKFWVDRFQDKKEIIFKHFNQAFKSYIYETEGVNLVYNQLQSISNFIDEDKNQFISYMEFDKFFYETWSNYRSKYRILNGSYFNDTLTQSLMIQKGNLKHFTLILEYQSCPSNYDDKQRTFIKKFIPAKIIIKKNEFFNGIKWIQRDIINEGYFAIGRNKETCDILIPDQCVSKEQIKIKFKEQVMTPSQIGFYVYDSGRQFSCFRVGDTPFVLKENMILALGERGLEYKLACISAPEPPITKISNNKVFNLNLEDNMKRFADRNKEFLAQSMNSDDFTVQCNLQTLQNNEAEENTCQMQWEAQKNANEDATTRMEDLPKEKPLKFTQVIYDKEKKKFIQREVTQQFAPNKPYYSIGTSQENDIILSKESAFKDIIGQFVKNSQYGWVLEDKYEYSNQKEKSNQINVLMRGTTDLFSQKELPQSNGQQLCTGMLLNLLGHIFKVTVTYEG